MEGSHFLCLCCVFMLCTIVPTLPIHEVFMILIFVLAFLIVLCAIIITDRCTIIYNETDIDAQVSIELALPDPIIIINPDPNDISIGQICIAALENETKGKLQNTSIN